MKKHIYISIFLFFLNTVIFAQKVSHLNFWGKFSFSQSVTEKCKIEAQLQHRTQNDFAEHKTNILDQKLLSSIGIWIYYQYKSDLSFSFSPFAYYWHNAILVNSADKSKPQTQEIRFSIAADLRHKMLENLWLIDRNCLEYRDFINSDTDYIRMRNRLGLKYAFNKEWNLTSYYELFFKIKNLNSKNFFDHNRSGFVLNYKPNSHLSIETGYVFITRIPKDVNQLLEENNFLVHLYYTLPYKEHNRHAKT